MAGIRFADLFADIEAIVNLTGQRAMVRRLINEACASIASEFNELPWLWDDDFFPTVAEHTTGNVDVTNGSITVNGGTSAPSFTAAMVGRKFRVGTENAFYKVATFVSSTSITLEQAYQGSTSTNESYSIFQDEFKLRADVDQYKIIRQIENGVPLFSIHPSDLDIANATPNSLGSADFEIMIGSRQDTYTTGTVAMTTGTRTITGASSPAWLGVQGLGRGTKIQIGLIVFTVNTVDSNTQITTYEAATSTISAGTSYVALLDNIVVQLFTIPDTAENYYYRFQRIPRVLDADQDFPDLPHSMHSLIKLWVHPWLWEHKGFADRKTASEKSYAVALAKAKSHYGFPGQDRIYRRKPAGVHRLPARPRLTGHGIPIGF